MRSDEMPVRAIEPVAQIEAIKPVRYCRDTALAVYKANIRATYAHFDRQVEAVVKEWIRSDMSITERDRRLSAIRAERDHWLEQERDLYHLNMATP